MRISKSGRLEGFSLSLFLICFLPSSSSSSFFFISFLSFASIYRHGLYTGLLGSNIPLTDSRFKLVHASSTDNALLEMRCCHSPLTSACSSADCVAVPADAKAIWTSSLLVNDGSAGISAHSEKIGQMTSDELTCKRTTISLQVSNCVWTVCMVWCLLYCMLRLNGLRGVCPNWAIIT